MSTEILYQEIQNLKEMIENLNSQHKEYLNIKEASKYLSISESTLYKITSSRIIEFYQPNGKLILFKRKDLDLYIEKGRKRTQDSIREEAKSIINNKFR